MLDERVRDGEIEALLDGRCPRCRSRLVVTSPWKTVMRNAILRVERGGRVTAKCGRCNTRVEVPLRYVGRDVAAPLPDTKEK